MKELIVRPVMTEKITALGARRQYAFEVPESANKIEIGRAVEKKFNVKVTSVRTMRVPGKAKTQMTRKGRFQGRTASWKKALVTLKEGDTIELFTNA